MTNLIIVNREPEVRYKFQMFLSYIGERHITRGMAWYIAVANEF